MSKEKIDKKLGYWASQEQYAMQDLLKFVIEAEKNGFDSCLTSDHFHPWWHDNGYGNFTWIWIAAAAERTKSMQFITGVTAAVYRYNPAIIAQAFASLDALYPGRIGLGIGTGEAMNEVPLGFDWPDAKTRLARTTEAIQIIKKLWKREGEEQVKKGKENVISYDDNDHNNGGFFHFNGKYFRIKNAKLYTPPSGKIPLYMAASGEEATRIAGQYTDGLITVQKPDKSKEIFDIFDKSASEQGKDPRFLDKIAKPKISYSEDYDKAFKATEFWRASLIDDIFDLDISDPRKLEQKAKEEVPDEKVKESTLIVTSIEDLIKPIEEYFKVGYTRVYVHSTSPNEIEFIQAFCDKILTYFNDIPKR
ncbi:MAG: LLM class flavin-dependent oxidoreductase [Thermoproteota archaeon]|nr:LLM class flavin-dependent oxidoreductase [Thermoproteota archaeon]